MQTAEAVGGVFFWLVVLVGLGLWLKWLLKWLRRNSPQLSCMAAVGEVILLGMFVIPTLTIGAYLGGKVDDFFGFEYGLNCLFLLGGFLAGAFMWRRVTRQ